MTSATDGDRLNDESLIHNKNAVFNALAAAKITTLVVLFDGCNDEGQIQDIQAKTGDEPINAPELPIEIVHAASNNPTLEIRTVSLTEGIEDVVYRLLQQTHPGWEINDGACGEFTFDVAARTILLRYDERYTETI